ncbi:Dihydrolipoyl dehydrogenase [Desulfosarcina cetonica]|nr:Dihydrolipoyl dehydrogenase [Desulfosarcina cetonica]
MSTPSTYDLVIIGAGPGGYVGAIRASQLGLKTCVVEKDKCGGVCLNWGCIPSKNLIHQAQTFAEIKALEDMGVEVNPDGFDYGIVQKKSRSVTQRLNKGIEFLLKKNKVELIKGEARIENVGKIGLSDGRTIYGKNIIIATGSRPSAVPGFEFDHQRVLSSNDILAMQTLPKSLIILGAGAIGCEFSYVMNTFGIKVTLVEMVDQVLPFEDDEIAAQLKKAFTKSGIDVLTGHKAVSMDKSGKDIAVTLADGNGKQQVVEAEKVLCVFGRRPNTEDIGLEKIGIETEKGYIPVGAYYQTAVSHVFAIGDVVATPLLAHVASKEAEIAIEYIAGHGTEKKIDVDAIPSAIYCEPQVASFGLRESQAKANGIQYKKTVFPYSAIGKAVAIDKGEGLVKVLTDPTSREILGCHIIGHDATELIHELLLAKSAELLPDDIARMVHAHPSLSEILMEVMRGTSGEAIHI